MHKVLLGPGVTLVSRNGIELSVPGSPTVICMFGSYEFMWCSSCVLCSALLITGCHPQTLNKGMVGVGQC